jgi:hypothetical protein
MTYDCDWLFYLLKITMQALWIAFLAGKLIEQTQVDLRAGIVIFVYELPGPLKEQTLNSDRNICIINLFESFCFIH